MPKPVFHPDELTLLAAIHAEPREDTPRLVLADWYQENEQPELAEFIRLHCQLGGVIHFPFHRRPTRAMYMGCKMHSLTAEARIQPDLIARLCELHRKRHPAWSLPPAWNSRKSGPYHYSGVFYGGLPEVWWPVTDILFDSDLAALPALPHHLQVELIVNIYRPDEQERFEAIVSSEFIDRAARLRIRALPPNANSFAPVPTSAIDRLLRLPRLCKLREVRFALLHPMDAERVKAALPQTGMIGEEDAP